MRCASAPSPPSRQPHPAGRRRLPRRRFPAGGLPQRGRPLWVGRPKTFPRERTSGDPVRVSPSVLGNLRRPVHPPPRPRHLFDVHRRPGEREVEQRRFVLRRRHAGQRPHLRVGDLPALHRGADERQPGQGVGDAHLLAGGAGGETGAPAQPVGAGGEAARPPAALLVELADEDEQGAGGGLDAGGELGDPVAQPVEIESVRNGSGVNRRRSAAWRTRFVHRVGARVRGKHGTGGRRTRRRNRRGFEVHALSARGESPRCIRAAMHPA